MAEQHSSLPGTETLQARTGGVSKVCGPRWPNLSHTELSISCREKRDSCAALHLEEQVPDQHCLWLAWATEADIFQEWPTCAKPLKISVKVEVSFSVDGAGFLVFPLGGGGNHGAPDTESVHSKMNR